MKISGLRALAFLFGLLWTWRINFVGSIYLAEGLAALAALLILVKDNSLFSSKRFQKISIAYLLILLGTVLADVYNDTTYENYLRGWATPIFGFLTLVFVLFVLKKDSTTVYWIFSGLFLSRIFGIGEIELDYIGDGGNYFKSTLAPAFFLIIALLGHHFSIYSVRISTLIVATSGILFVVLGARSAGLVLFISAAILGFRSIVFHGNIMTKVISGFLVLSLLQVTYIFYVNQVLGNPNNSNSYLQLSLLKNPYNPFALLAAGRTDFLVAFYAAQEQPIIGRGSWAGDPDGKFAELFFDLKHTKVTAYWDYIRSHSIIMTAWLWGGLTALSGAVMLGWTSAAMLRRTIGFGGPFLVLTVIFGVDLFWNFFFSPFGHIRTSVPFALAILLVQSYPLPLYEHKLYANRSHRTLVNMK